jgi:hypothetical protein
VFLGFSTVAKKLFQETLVKRHRRIALFQEHQLHPFSPRALQGGQDHLQVVRVNVWKLWALLQAFDAPAKFE